MFALANKSLWWRIGQLLSKPEFRQFVKQLPKDIAIVLMKGPLLSMVAFLPL